MRLDGVTAGTRTALFAVLLVAFGIKAAVFPLSTWLPDSYPTAPAPVTAVFAGLLTKVGVYAIIRAHSLLFPSGGLDPLLLVAALLTMLIGILGAIAQSDIKRLLSFTLVSHIGYMVFGIALSSQLGMSGAIYYVAHHIVVQTTLFLVVGLIERQAGASDAAAARRAGRRQPAPGVRVRGAGAQSRWHSAIFRIHRQGGAAGGGRTERLCTGLAAGRRQASLTSLLTLYVVVRVWTKAFWRSRGRCSEGHLSGGGAFGAPRRTGGHPVRRPRPRRAGCRSGWCCRRARSSPSGLTLTVMAGPIFAYAGRAADEVLDRGQYITAVVGRTAMSARAKSRLQMRRVALRAWVLLLADAGVDPVVGHGLCGQHHLRPGHRRWSSRCCCRCRSCLIEGRVHPLALIRLIARRVGYYLVLSSVQVAWLAVKPGPPPLIAVLRAHVAVKSDLVLALARQHLQPHSRHRSCWRSTRAAG